MEVILATAMGMCFGVRDALERTREVAEPTAVTIHGQLVHNPAVLAELRRRGFESRPERDREGLPRTPRVLITAHGVSDRERARLAAAGKELIDTTCPLVRKAHAAALRLARDGYHVLVIGQRGHVEVEGLIGDLESVEVVGGPGEVRHYAREKLGILCQTTTAGCDAAAVRAAVAEQNPGAEIRFIDTICQPTKDRQAAMEELLDAAEMVVVVGGKNSNNTRKLVERCAERGVPAFHVEGPGELRAEWFDGVGRVGLTAGTSTPGEVIAAVHGAMLGMGASAGVRLRAG